MENSINKWPEMKITPVGLVRSEIITPMLMASDSGLEIEERMEKIREYHQKVNNCICELVISPQWVELLDGIDGFSHVLVLYWPHLIDPERRKLRKVHPMGRRDLPLQGIFATCSPARPNPILVSAVPLIQRHKNILKVKGLEAVDGSPIIDIKPFVKSYHSADNTSVPEWMEKLHRELETNI
jgi:tRNA (adenine37-N6)-methyltransferase